MSVNQFLNGKLNLIAGAGGGTIADDNTFTGTTAEVEAAIAEGLIENDTIIFITDDVEEGENEEIEIEVLDTYDEIMANTELGKVAGAAGVKEGFETVNENFGGVRFGIDGEGNYGYFKGDDTFVPFRSGEITVHYDSWILAGGLNPTEYASLDELLEDEAAVRTLMTKKTAVDVLTTLDETELDTIIRHRYAAKWINYREYAYSTLSAIDDIKDIMDETGMYGMYITAESKIKPLVPVLTSNTGSDGGTAFSNSNYGNYQPYMSFNNNNIDCWHSALDVTNCYVGYKFTKLTKVNKMSIDYCSGMKPSLDMILQGSKNGSEWVNLVIISSRDLPKYIDGDTSTHYNYEIEFANEEMYIQYRLFSPNGFYTTTNSWFGVNELQFYGYQLEGLIPTMTSNTSPSGEASASIEYNNGGELWSAWKAFKGGGGAPYWSAGNTNQTEWLQYKFDEPICVKAFKLLPWYNQSYGSELKNFEIVASNNGTVFDMLYTGIVLNDGATIIENLNNNNFYTYYRIKIIDSYRDGYKAIQEFQLYGEPALWQPKGLVPVMTSNTAPYGEVIYNATHSTNLPWHAFDGDKDTNWVNNANTSAPHWLGYKFTKPTVVSRIALTTIRIADGTRIKDFKVQGSNDNSLWVDLSETLTFPQGTSSSEILVTESFDILNSENYLYYRIYTMSVSGDKDSPNIFNVKNLQFYGRQLEALIPPMTSNTTPIGECFASEVYNTNTQPYKAFDGDTTTIGNNYWAASNSSTTEKYIGYDFGRDVVVKYLEVLGFGGSNRSDFDFDLQYSDDKSTWINAGVSGTANPNTNYYICPENTPHRYWRIIKTQFLAEYYTTDIVKLQFYGVPDYESRTYIYDHGVEVMELTKDINNSGFMPAIIREDTIYLQPRTDGGKYNAGTVLTSNSISMGKYSMLCLNMGYDIKFIDGSYGNIGVGNKIDNSTNPVTWAPLAFVRPASNIPNARVDITSINESAYCVALSTYADYFDISEWWLE